MTTDHDCRSEITPVRVERSHIAGIARSRGRTGSLTTLAFSALVLSPLLSGCMSGLSDLTSVGLAPSQTVAESSAPVDVGSAPEVDVSALQAESGDAATTEISDDAAREVAAATPATSERQDKALIPLSSGGETVAAYAGGTVGEGSASGRSASSGGSLFQSLFARQAPRTPIANAERGKTRRVVLNRDGAPSSAGGDSALPGVDAKSLFEIGQRASADEDAIEDATYEVAALSGGFARLSPNGLRVQRENIRTDCFPRELVGMIRAIEQRFGQRVVVTSGYRSPSHNKRVRGAKRSQHMACKAADIIIPNTNSRQVAAFVRSLPGRGGVGTYCHTKAIHIDTGPKREWNWRCRRKR